MSAESAYSDVTVPVDRAYLERQRAGLGALTDIEEHYIRQGLADGLNPTRWFLTDWYAWQNPDWTAFASPYLHYLEVGRHEARDPSPYVDIRRYLEVTGPLQSPGAVYDLILRGLRSSALGVYEDLDDLRRAQLRFLGAISCLAHRHRWKDMGRKALVVLQAGQSSVAGNWYNDNAREWDLLVNYYDASGFDPGFGDYVFFQKGTKFTAMWLLWERFGSLLNRYDHVLFLDDDIITNCDNLNRLFRSARAHNLDLSQMALTEGSFCNWSELFAKTNAVGPRSVSTVEIMMPVMSRRALELVSPTFGKSISGFGLDLVWGKIVSEAGGRIAVLDDAQATHSRPVDQADGSYYTYLRRNGINSKAELWALVNEFDAMRDVMGT